jgi:predicted DNA-binding protein
VRTQSNSHRLVALNFRVPLDLRRRLKILAASRSVTMTNLLLEILERFDREETPLVKKE